MAGTTVKKGIKNEAELKKPEPIYSVPEPFSKECFVSSIPRIVECGDSIPMWWEIVHEPGVTFKQYKKDKKRAERESVKMQEYVRNLEKENQKYSEKLKQESEKYKLECDMRDHAFNERRKKEELILSAEKEQSKMRLLEEEKESQAKLLEYERSLAEDREKKREEEAQRKFELKKAKIEAEEIEERKKIQAKEQVERVRLEAEAELERKKEERRERERQLKLKEIEADRLDMEERNAEKVRQAELEAQKRIEEEENLARELALREEESARILCERERIREAHKADRLKRAEEEQKRMELARIAEKRTVEQLRKAHSVKDFEFQYPMPEFGERSEDNIVELSGVCTKTRKDKKHLCSPVYATIKRGVSVTSEFGRREMDAICAVLKREVKKGEVLSGGVRYDSKELSHEMTAKKYREISRGRFEIFSYNEPKLEGLGSVSSYIKSKIGQDKIILAIDYLQRLNVRSVRSLLKKRACKCMPGEVARILLVCALLSTARVVVLCEPQRYLDVPARYALKNIIAEWQGESEDRALFVLTQDEEFLK